jgi:hypothetical protein
MKLATNQHLRIAPAIKETERAIEKEMKYAPDLRRHDFIARMQAHLEKLKGMLETLNK